MNTLLEAESVTVTRNGRDILRDVSVRIGSEDFITVIGPNGAGKSMLLKCLLGFHRPDKGTVRRKTNLKASYMPQRLVPDHIMPLTVSRFMRLRKDTTSENIAAAAQETGVADALDRQLWTLSGGELQRVMLARSLLHNPELLVLDEPAQSLDIAGQFTFYELLERVHRERGVSILVVSHNLHMVMARTRKVLCLFHHVCCSGEPHAVAKDPEFIAMFGEDMAKMIAVYRHSHDHNHENHNNV